MNLYTVYRAHNYHFKIYGAMFLGQARTALDAAGQLAAAIPEDLLRVESPPMADWLEGFVAMKLHVLIRFGRWRDILAVPLPGDQELYRFARGLHCGGEITGLALKLWRLERTVCDDHRSVQVVEVALGAQCLLDLVGELDVRASCGEANRL